MLTWSFVIERIKDELGLPFQPLEFTDEQVQDYLQRNALKKFEKYFPAVRRITLDTTVSEIHVPNRNSEFYVIDPDNRQILDVQGFWPTQSEDLILGHPWLGVFNYESIPAYTLQVLKAMTTKLWSIYDYTVEYIPPNVLRVSPQFRGSAVVQYEAELDEELTDITPQIEDYFVELCVAMMMKRIGRIRQKYQNISTPFGEIQLNADQLYSEGEQKLNDLVEQFERGSLPNVIFDRG